ncbi:hypothetical protein QFC20_006275 [Naganishia adeliensis]|uniref:Uncharacterized protein n=1 Tax=Naganishia adeliensis TaxID=92952 RepID=A0ACC2VDM5_9TREE|nr:hypothetical protein QFC20_006275 [Naganishia adeliensis]
MPIYTRPERGLTVSIPVANSPDPTDFAHQSLQSTSQRNHAFHSQHCPPPSAPTGASVPATSSAFRKSLPATSTNSDRDYKDGTTAVNGSDRSSIQGSASTGAEGGDQQEYDIDQPLPNGGRIQVDRNVGGTATFHTSSTEPNTGGGFLPKVNPGAYESHQDRPSGSTTQDPIQPNVVYKGKNEGGVRMEKFDGNVQIGFGPGGMTITSGGVTYTAAQWNAKLERDAQQSRAGGE